MAGGLADPKGYWRILELSPGSDGAAVKRAYRKKAMQLHPDRNTSPNAVGEFQLLGEAYRTLSDPVLRKAYEAGHTATNRRSAAQSAQQPRQQHGRQNARQQTHTTQAPPPPPPPPPRNQPTQAPKACSACGQVTAQPRYLILEKVTGRLWRTEREPISGVFCRRCGERLALLASLHCWARGWWALPMGPLHTISALWTNLRGGLTPARENAALLLHQSRAFLSRGDRRLAQGLARQALRFAKTPGDKEAVERVLNATGADSEARLRDAWRGRGPGFWIQLAPPAVLVFVVFYVLWPALVPPGSETTPPSEEAARPTPPPIPSFLDPTARAPLPDGRARLHKAVTDTILRTGPGLTFAPANSVESGSYLVVLEITPDRAWARVVTPDSRIGFVPLNSLAQIEAAPDAVPPADADNRDPAIPEGASIPEKPFIGPMTPDGHPLPIDKPAP